MKAFEVFARMQCGRCERLEEWLIGCCFEDDQDGTPPKGWVIAEIAGEPVRLCPSCQNELQKWLKAKPFKFDDTSRRDPFNFEFKVQPKFNPEGGVVGIEPAEQH